VNCPGAAPGATSNNTCPSPKLPPDAIVKPAPSLVTSLATSVWFVVSTMGPLSVWEQLQSDSRRAALIWSNESLAKM